MYKKALSILVSLILTCSLNAQRDSCEFRIILPDTIFSSNNDIPIILEYYNYTNTRIVLRDFSCFGNVRIVLNKDGKEISLPKVKIIPSTLNQSLRISAGSHIRIEFCLTMKDFLSAMSLTGRYELMIEIQEFINGEKTKVPCKKATAEFCFIK